MDVAEQDIQNDKYTLVSRFLYGGLFSGAVVVPTNFIKIILTLIFPPLGTILEIIGNALLNEFPYITWDTLKKIFEFKNLNKILYTFVLTSMFYVPGLVYTLAQLTTTQNNVKGVMQCDPDTGNCTILDTTETQPAKK
jgi:hypothetical protein